MAITAGELASQGAEIGWSAAIARLAGQCEPLAAARIDFLLLREKALLPRHLAELATLCAAVSEVVSGSGTRVLVAAPAAVAAGLAVAGVHLGAQGDVRAARRVLPGAFVSVSCHTLAEVERAREDRVDAILFAPVFGKWVKGVEVVPGAGLDALHSACLAAGEVPVLALGGVTEHNAAECVQAGAAGIAGIRMFF